MRINQYGITLLSLSLVACQSTDRPVPSSAKAELNHAISAVTKAQNSTSHIAPPPALPTAVQQELAADQLLAKKLIAPKERRFDVNAKDVDAKVFFPSLIHNTPLSIVVHPNVSGKVSLALKAVTLAEVLQVIQDIYGYEVSREGRILRVYPAGLRTETFPVNYLYMQREGLSITSVNSGRLSDNQGNNRSNNQSNRNSSGSRSGSSNEFNSESSHSSGNNNTNGTFIRSTNKTDFWKDLQQTLSSIIGSSGNGRQVVTTPQAGLVTVRAFPDELRQVREFLSKAESHLQRQVILETKIIEVTLSDGYQQGIQWSDVVSQIGHNDNTNVNFGTSQGDVLSDVISRSLGGVTSLSLTGTDFTAMINLLKTQGDVDVLSSPRVTASNNQKAVIKVGSDEYFVTDVSSTVISAVNGSNPVAQPEVELTPFFSGIALDVTPQIDDNGGVLLHVHPSVIDINEQTKSINIGDNPLILPLAQSQIRESDTVIKAISGDVVVIGGLMKTEKQDATSKVPLLGDIPLIGELFTNRSKVNRKTELIILLKPTVVGEGTWKSELERSQQLLDRWYPEGHGK
ncbi:pilus (MSHA type) biogenesis protein MshL [Parashewanella spongiae]|uniref:Pilus (MSHA type) biogenesis protein MshL n=1 Tax=Parashewanella spongiae TaxID=342950 RepID=A0A3A6UCM1_9GAMM|nr:pilus (MSHA type) biogenesis protein MshL [Parashewanella spongiae]MCL1078238.1 pilus (MSHA type) biogenesis protein MshL [Parashewanella spongiae]RJY15113.1 pilus (MSHA type) biogenesis protein MshL [Parashewanella spongiae]